MLSDYILDDFANARNAVGCIYIVILYTIHVRPTDLTNTARTNNSKRLAGGLTDFPDENALRNK